MIQMEALNTHSPSVSSMCNVIVKALEGSISKLTSKEKNYTRPLDFQNMFFMLG